MTYKPSGWPKKRAEIGHRTSKYCVSFLACCSVVHALLHSPKRAGPDINCFRLKASYFKLKINIPTY